ncbi:hypothetical protein KZZ52_16970 [Dactylosporangium sp. AC04546]|uniref:hypothetical protein n=1 Tax=Dactylosporangium sp. AC04546 TaxID=2862460 RepID=UPI001EE0A4B9|nr:hypothetical protein [Dactylosporangium sp. AC04546]WVK86993.1 hypothetical protein KZZ52_16970 [Dactylosporangium sp. AC04546]
MNSSTLRRRAGRALTAGLAALAVALTGAQPASPSPVDKLEEYGKYAGHVKTAYDIYQKLFGNEMTLQRAVDELQAAIARVSEQINGVLDEVGEIAAADVETCARTALVTFADIESLSADNAQQFATDATECVARARAYINVVDNRAAVDVMSYALNALGPVALFARANVGFGTTLLRDDLVAANRRAVERLEPSCLASPLWGDALPGQPVEVQLACTAFNGRVGYDVTWAMITRGGPLPSFDFSQARDRSLELSSAPIAEEALATLLGPGPASGSSIAAGAGLDGALRVCGTSASDGIFCRSGSAAWSQLDGELHSVAVERNDDGRLELFGVNREGTLWHRWQTGAGGWSGWASLGGPFTSVAVARNGQGRLELFATYLDGAVQHRWQNVKNTTTDWSGWSTLGGAARYVAAEANGDGRVEVFAIDAAGGLSHRWQLAAGGWSGWSPFDGTLRTVALARNSDQRLELFGTNRDGMVWHRWQLATGGWSSWSRIDGTYSGVAADGGADGHVELFAVDAAGKLFRWEQPAAGWTAYDSGLRLRP